MMTSQATPPVKVKPLFPIPDCAINIADAYQVPIEIVVAVRHVESSGNHGVGKVCGNKNGSCDIGAMQINEYWLPRLHKQNISDKLLIENECVNIAVGTWILSSNYHSYKDWTAALSAYNTGRPSTPVGLKYAEKVLSNIKSPNGE